MNPRDSTATIASKSASPHFVANCRHVIESLGTGQQRRNVLEYYARLREVRNVTNVVFQIHN